MDIRIGDVVKFNTITTPKYILGEVKEILNIEESFNEELIGDKVFFVSLLDEKYQLIRLNSINIKSVYREVKQI